MKKTFKLSIVMLCILMLFASCAGSPEVKFPSADIAGNIEGAKTNPDGTITLPGAGVVLNENGSIAGEVYENGSYLITPDGNRIEGRVMTNEENALIGRVMETMCDPSFMSLCVDEKTPDGYMHMALTKEIVIGDITYHSYIAYTDEPSDDFLNFVTFTVGGKKHTFIDNNCVYVFDGELIDRSVDL